MASSILPSNRRTAALFLVLCSLLLTAVPGCSGCFGGGANANANKKKDEKEKEKPKPDFQVGRLRVQPSDDTSQAKNAVKPGHWTVATQQLLANNFEFPAELYAESVDRGGQTLRVDATQYQLTLSTPAPLPKGQPMNYEMTFYVPPIRSRDTGARTAAWLHSQLRSRRGGREVADTMQPTTSMPKYQYYLVVLADDPSRYTALKRLDTVMPPSSELDESTDIIYYRVLLPSVERGAPLPSHSLAWTSIAYLIWDGMDPTLLTPYQQDAMLDWLHFGGQVVISGPASLDQLRGSFLDPYLPADKVKAVDLDQGSIQQLNETWSLFNARTKRKELLTLDTPLVGCEIKIRPEGNEVANTGGLVAERMVGRGRIVVSGLPLGDRRVKSWECYDSFVHNALLRRPPRVFDKRGAQDYAKARFLVTGGGVYDRDARLATAYRLFSRDVQTLATIDGTAPAVSSADTGESRYKVKGLPWRFGGFSEWADGGVGAWNDRSGASNAARESLKRAAGITIPSGAFVLKVLVIYLIFLVPVNWGVFRLIGRVEWAWIAAPIIAIIGSIAVVRLAQLDIGFARARTEVAILELHGDYKRGHLTRYTALYTSLSTTYDFVFSDQSALAQPFPANLNYQHSPHDTTYRVNYRRDKDVVLGGFTVPSNSTGMVHSEHMHQMAGGLKIVGDADSGFQLINNSELTIHEAGILRGVVDGIEVAYVGELPPKTTKALTFIAPLGSEDRRDLPIAEWRQSKIFGHRQIRTGEVSLSSMIQLAAKSLDLADGDVRLVGWTDNQLKGADIRPVARQVNAHTLVLAHLVKGTLPDAKPDQNLRAEFEDRPVRTDDIGEDNGNKDAPDPAPNAIKPRERVTPERNSSDPPETSPSGKDASSADEEVSKPAEKNAAEDKPAEETPKPAENKKPATDDKPTNDKPADGKPADEKPVEDKSTEEKPAEEKPAAPKGDPPADEKPAEPKAEKPADEKPAEEKPAEPSGDKPSPTKESAEDPPDGSEAADSPNSP